LDNCPTPIPTSRRLWTPNLISRLLPSASAHLPAGSWTAPALSSAGSLARSARTLRPLKDSSRPLRGSFFALVLLGQPAEHACGLRFCTVVCWAVYPSNRPESREVYRTSFDCALAASQSPPSPVRSCRVPMSQRCLFGTNELFPATGAQPHRGVVQQRGRNPLILFACFSSLMIRPILGLLDSLCESSNPCLWFFTGAGTSCALATLPRLRIRCSDVLFFRLPISMF